MAENAPTTPTQSPIELRQSSSIYVASLNLEPFEYNYCEAPYSGTFQGEVGHRNFVLTEPYPGLHPPMIRLGDIRARLIKIHLHTPPEHDLEGDDTGGEIHLIHEIVAPTTGSTLLVLGVFFRERAEDAHAPMKGFFDTWTKGCASETGEVTIDPRCLLPDTSEWYRYEGSLTTKPYDEIVSWLVFTKPLGIDSQSFKQLRERAHQPERGLQDVNRRFVLRNFKKA
jgi:carbonic anhydrase